MPDSVPQSVLVVDDSPDVHKLVAARLNSEGLTILHASDAGQAREILVDDDEPPDLILLDLDMPETDGMSFCRELKESPEWRDIPVIFLTGTLEVSVKVQAFELGAVDYVTKPFNAVELKARVRSALRTKRYQDMLATQARIDALTGLWNRGYFDEQLTLEVSLARRGKNTVSLMMIDIDHFKSINDKHGHPFGDKVIERTSSVISDASRDSDLVCRYGGEEFAVILRGTDTEGALVIAERLREEIEAIRLARSGRKKLRFTASIGVAGSDQYSRSRQVSFHGLLDAADSALYRAKSEGRNRVVLGSPEA